METLIRKSSFLISVQDRYYVVAVVVSSTVFCYTNHDLFSSAVCQENEQKYFHGDVNDLLVFASCTRHPLRNPVIVLLSAKAGCGPVRSPT